MTFLPIVQRELIEASRRRGTYWIRVCVASAGLLIGIWVLAFPELRTPSRIGMALFIPLAIISMIYCAIIGVFRTADCLSEEKREGTLGLLFLTDLKGYDIVFGKLFATSLNAVYGLLALFPVLAIPLLAGGVTLIEFGRVVLVSLNTLFFSLAIGMLCSALHRDERRAMVWAFGLTAFFVIGLPILAAIIEDTNRWRKSGLAEMVCIPSPSFGALFAFEEPRRGATWATHFQTSVLTVHALSWLMLLIGSIIVPRTWQDRPLSPAAQKRRETFQQLGAAPVTRRTLLRNRLLTINPYLWIAARGRFKMIAVWTALFLGGIAWTLGLILNPADWKDEFAYLMTAVMAHTLLKFWVVTESSRRFSLDRQSGALELILSTPLSARDVIRGQVLGLERLFAGPIFVVLLADFVFLMATRHRTGWPIIWSVGMIVFLADIFALSWLGMWRGLNSRRPNRAALAALLRILVLPWILLALLVTFLELSSLGQNFRSSFWDEYKLPLIYLGISLGIDAWYGLTARERLTSQFRQVATQQFETRSRK